MALIAALATLVLALSGFTATGGWIAGSPARPSLRALDLHPLKVRGRHFKAGERVRVVLVSQRRWTRRVTASATGSFTANFGELFVRPCGGLILRAFGARGSRAESRISPGVARDRVAEEAAWLDLLRSDGLEPARKAVLLAVEGSAPELTITLTLPADAPAAVVFPDALYGVVAYAFDGKGWQRVDRAEVRAALAPIIEPGESRTTTLPVERADAYRVLAPVEGKGAWRDSGAC